MDCGSRVAYGWYAGKQGHIRPASQGEVDKLATEAAVAKHTAPAVVE